MKCLKCSARTDVYDSRLVEGEGYRRKRKCTKCEFRFATLEVLDTSRQLRDPTVQKVKPAKPARVIKAKPPKQASRGRSEKTRQDDDDMYEENSITEDIWDVARELGIEGYR